jgi:hypothetical protein
MAQSSDVPAGEKAGSYLLGRNVEAQPEDAQRTWSVEQLRLMDSRFRAAISKAKIAEQKLR